ncbi:MAG: nucleotidyltransferase domain-containing protein, partial [Ignisphaera sp.]
LISNLKVYAIILTGSRARGNYKPWSDYDILIIAEFREKHLDRITKILELLKDIELNIEPHPYTIEEATEMLKKKPTNNRHTIRRKNPIHHKKIRRNNQTLQKPNKQRTHKNQNNNHTTNKQHNPRKQHKQPLNKHTNHNTLSTTHKLTTP